MFYDHSSGNFTKVYNSSGLNEDSFKMTDKTLEGETVTYRRVSAQSVDFRDMKVINNLASLSTSNMLEDIDEDSRDSGFENYFRETQESTSTLCFDERTVNLNDIVGKYEQLPSNEFDFEDDIEECLEYDIVSIDNDDTIPLGYRSNANDLLYGTTIAAEEITISFNKNSDKTQSLHSDNDTDFEFD